jgi:transcription elongation factor Elf1
VSQRSCETCGSRMSPWLPRKRVGDALVCKGCEQRTAHQVEGSAGLNWMKGGPWTEGGETFQRGPYAGVAFGDGRWEVHFNQAPLTSGTAASLAEAKGAVEEAVADHHTSRFAARQGRRVLAHDSGDGETIYHCPFCGAGQVVGRSDGTAECGFCSTAFTVQVQPSMSAVPQTIDGTPHVHPDMPGQEPGVPEEEQEAPEDEMVLDDAEEEDNPIFASRRATRWYLTAEGVALEEDAYIRHLAIHHADDRQAVIAAVRAERTP